MRLLYRLADACLPTARNSYRPHLLGKSATALFLALALVAEAHFVTGIFGLNPAAPFLSAAVAQAGAPQSADWVLLALALVLAGLLAAALAAHAHIQPGDMILPGAVVLGIVILLLVLNTWYSGAHGIS